MLNIKHIIIVFNQKEEILYNEEDVFSIKKYLKVYKKRYCIDILGFGLNGMFLHLLIRDTHNNFKEFLDTIIESIDCYFNSNLSTELNLIRYKCKDIDNENDILEIVKYCNSMEYSSVNNYKNYSKYKYDDFVDTHLLCNYNKGLNNSLLNEASADYIIKIKNEEIYSINDKTQKRRKRALTYLEKFLEKENLSKEELHNNDVYKGELIKSFRKETDLSFRDIGYVLEISHTSVIRIWNKMLNRN